MQPKNVNNNRTHFVGGIQWKADIVVKWKPNQIHPPAKKKKKEMCQLRTRPGTYTLDSLF